MPKDIISSVNNQQVKNLGQLLKKAKDRKEQGVFVIEGIKMFEEARTEGLLVKAYCSESFYRRMVQEQPYYFNGLDYDILTDHVFEGVSETKTPQGILGTVRIPHYHGEDIWNRPRAFVLLLEDIRDPGNLGTIIRTAEGAGVTGIILNHTCVDLFNPKVIRSTMGSIYRVPFAVTDDFTGEIRRMGEKGIRIFAAHLSGRIYDREDGFNDNFAILIGNEANGLSEEVSGLADSLIRIPMEGKVESLNAAVAAAILMYEAARKRRSFGEGE